MDGVFITGRIAIETVVSSRVMDELMDLAMSAQPSESSEEGSGEGGGAGGASDAYLRQQRAKNWFSAENALRVYNTVRSHALALLNLHVHIN